MSYLSMRELTVGQSLTALLFAHAQIRVHATYITLATSALCSLFAEEVTISISDGFTERRGKYFQ